MISHEKIEEFIRQYPVYQYAFFSPKDIDFSYRVRWICENECERYNTTWACPPAVGTVEECRKRCLEYKECFLYSTVAEVSDVINFQETLSTRREHEEITASIEAFIRKQGSTCTARCLQNPVTSVRNVPSQGPYRFPKECTPVWKPWNRGLRTDRKIRTGFYSESYPDFMVWPDIYKINLVLSFCMP